MKFPIIIIIKDHEAPIYFCDQKQFGLLSKGGNSFYNDGTIYDSSGCKYEIFPSNSIKKASLFVSIKYFQQMYYVDVKTNFIEKISIVEFKKVVIKHINEFSHYGIKKIQ